MEKNEKCCLFDLVERKKIQNLVKVMVMVGLLLADDFRLLLNPWTFPTPLEDLIWNARQMTVFCCFEVGLLTVPQEQMGSID